ncbi:hypothetical protein ACFY20_12425 [Streptomyces sp. NPDC001312]|uniref:hypothetical protein n=1 Tax=Streptomyces sp. NPDC001312 TaxID=3364561 RepID=UPI0036AAC510
MRTDRCEVPYDPDAAGPAPDGATTTAVEPAPEPKTDLRAAPTAVSDDAAASAPGGAATAESSAAATGLGAVPGPEAGLRAAPAARPTAVSAPDSAAAAASGPAPGAGLGPEDGASAPAIRAPKPATPVSATHAQAPGGLAAAVSGPEGQGAPAPGGALAAVREAGSTVTALSGAAAEVTSLAPLLDWALRALAAVGALTDGDGQATLTPLGSWAVWVKLEQICVAAQSPAGNIEQSAEDMLRGCAQLRPNAARAEYRAWLAARPVGSAVTELLGGARGEDALLRGLAFEALRVVGAPAEPDVRAVLDEPALRPYALLWLAEHDGIDAEDAHEVLTREEATWLWVDTAAAVTDHGEASMLVRHLEAAVQPTVPMLLDEVRTVGHPRTVQVLVALAAAHPDPALAKAVRRAAFQVHTGGS